MRRMPPEESLDDGDEFGDLDNVAPIRRIQPGDLLDVVRRLRRLMAEYDTTAFTLYASFEGVGGPDIEESATKARRAAELAGARLYALLGAVERLPAFVEMKKEVLARSKQKDGSHDDD